MTSDMLRPEMRGLLDLLKALQTENLAVINPITRLPSLEEQRKYIRQLERDGGMLLACDCGGIIVGVLSCARMKKRVRPRGNIGMSVAESHRRKGIGEALLIRLMDEARRRNLFEVLWLKVDDRNLPARKLYEMVGFEYVDLCSCIGSLEMAYDIDAGRKRSEK